MVYVKENDSDHVYENGIEVQEDDEYYYADGTSLGSDNGIAIAYCLAVLDSEDLKHPDLEIVFTVKEEVGLIGADIIDISSLKGTRFINLDSEERRNLLYKLCRWTALSDDLECGDRMSERRADSIENNFQGTCGWSFRD